MLTDATIHATIAAKDLDRARTWYADKLGWTPIDEMNGVLIYEVDQERFVVYETPSAGTAQNTIAGWIVDDLRAEVARLRSRGVVIEDVDLGDSKTVDGILEDDSGELNAWFRDADGNWIALAEADQEADDRFWREHGYTNAPLPNRRGLRPLLAASDLDRARTWYADKLGLIPYRELEGEILIYWTGATRFSIFPTPSAGTARNTVASWWVDDLASVVAELRSNGVTLEDYDFGDARTIDGILTDEDGQTAWFKDSEGNILGVGEYPALIELEASRAKAAPAGR